ncbi:hypothetical protein BCF44_107271 [Kutzneria buriramensis]|uniref:Uncharacterized protein n=2 Tax=Kutzneria buriramensis TaxID=1045776 RepID=A0A3E0HIA1_9PSEU|nr:hypothetical protein BCF44_107271 [Kutzneria buriramensis]
MAHGVGFRWRDGEAGPGLGRLGLIVRFGQFVDTALVPAATGHDGADQRLRAGDPVAGPRPVRRPPPTIQESAITAL